MAWTLATLSVFGAAACGGVGAAAEPAAAHEPLAAPTPYEISDGVPPTPMAQAARFAPVVNELGYALAPGRLPDGFELGTVDMLMFPSNPTGRQIYTESAENNFELHISYPMRFPPNGGSLFEHAGFGLPQDAVSEVSMADRTGYVIKGGWDPESLRLEFPSEAIWDYERSLTVMIAYQMDSMEPVWVAIRAENRPGSWITVAELVSIAESIGKVR